VKLIGKLQDGTTVFVKKGHEEDEEPFEFKIDEGIIFIYTELGILFPFCI